MNQLPGAAAPLLIVDDDPTFSRVLARALASRGFEVLTADNAIEARALARRHQPRYCVLDLKLGDENGLKLIPDLQALVPEIRVLLLTGYASIATAVEAIKRGAHDYLAKPVDADAVVRALLDDDGGAGDDELIDAPDAPLPLRRLNGNTSSAYSPSATATSPRRRGGWACIAAPCSASSASIRCANGPTKADCLLGNRLGIGKAHAGDAFGAGQ